MNPALHDQYPPRSPGLGHVRQAWQLIAFRNAAKTGPVSERGRPQGELNAFRNAAKTAADSFHLGRQTQSDLPESAVFFPSRPAVSRVVRFWNESAVFGTTGPFLERVVGQPRVCFRCRAGGSRFLGGKGPHWPPSCAINHHSGSCRCRGSWRTSNCCCCRTDRRRRSRPPPSCCRR